MGRGGGDLPVSPGSPRAAQVCPPRPFRGEAHGGDMNQASGLDLLKIVSPGGREGPRFPSSGPTPALRDELCAGRERGGRRGGSGPRTPGRSPAALLTWALCCLTARLPSPPVPGFAQTPCSFPLRRDRAGVVKVFMCPLPPPPKC